MSNDRPASGSRWEPAAPGPEVSATDAHAQDAPHAAPGSEDTAGYGAAQHAAGQPTAPVATLAPPPPADPPAPAGRPRRRGRIRTAIAAAVLLVVGGAGGYWIGHATASTSGPAAGPGLHQRGGFPGRGGLDDDGDGRGFGVAPNSQNPNGQNGGTGTGTGTGTATGTGVIPGTGVTPGTGAST